MVAIRPEEPSSTPSVSWFSWCDGLLSAPGGKAITIIGPDGMPSTTPCDWPAPAPVAVTLPEGGWRLPVIVDGVLVAPHSLEMTVEDVLASLCSFPEPPDGDPPDGAPPGEEPIANALEVSTVPQATYPIRRMMELLVRLGETQVGTDPRDWQRWCRELRQNLCAIAAQEREMIGFFRNARANPLQVLADMRVRPKGADASLLKTALAEVTKEWNLGDCLNLWSGDVA